MPAYILYSTSHCHLCEQAIALLQPIVATLGGTLTIVDIIGDEALYVRYGLHIPVLEHPKTRRFLYWPFDAETVLDFLQSQK